MKQCYRKISWLLGLSFIALVACSQQKSVVLKDLQGKTINFSSYRGQWVVVNYWASWCRPCWEEIPELNHFYQAHKNKDVVVLGVSYDQATPSQQAKLAKKMKIAFPVLASDPAKALGFQDLPGLPATYIINPEGKVVRSLFGPQTYASLETAITAKD